MPRLASSVLFPALLTALACTNPEWARAGDDQTQARQALERGEIHSLDEVLKAVHAAAPGDVVKLELQRDGGRWLYKLKILSPEGRRREVKIDAGSLKIVDEDDDDD